MAPVHRLGLAAALSVLGLPAQAESLRCNGHFVGIGDSRLSVLHKCGEPLLKDSSCAPLYLHSPLQPAPVLILGGPCVQADEWLYDRGDGFLMATVRFQQGKVQSIRYSRSPD